MAVNGITGAYYMIQQLEKPTSYSEADCVKAAVVNVIRHCSGGDPSYRCAGCTELWNSYDKTGRYHHIVERLTIDETKRSGLLIGDLPCIYNPNTGKCEHIAYYMGGIGGYEVIHSSATRGCVAATYLKNGFTHILRHKLIKGIDPDSAGGNDDDDEKEMDSMATVIYMAKVSTPKGGALNLRSSPSTSARVLTEIENGETVEVLTELGKWVQIKYSGSTGYVFADYVTRIASSSDEDDGTSDTTATASAWGIFVPCASKTAAQTLAQCFNAATVCQWERDD